MPLTPQDRIDALAAESIAYQYAIAVLFTHIAPAEIERAAVRLTDSEFTEYVNRAFGANQRDVAERLVSLGKDALVEIRQEFAVAGEIHPWRLLG